jgi:hypothetical protein
MKVFLFLVIYMCVIESSAQEPAEQLEHLAGDEQPIEDDSYSMQWEHYRKHPLQLNSADADQLKDLNLLNDLQIENFVWYRKFFGKLTSIYELQAIPSWDVATIRRLVSFVSVDDNDPLAMQLAKRFRKGDHSLLFRVSQSFEEKNSSYEGSPQRLLLRYRYNYKNVLQYGCTGEKDAGERITRGFDFYSAHFFVSRIGCIQSLALGDFTVNMGQGLMQWQGLAFKKSAEVLAIKRQSPLLRPHTSAGEIYFHRGAGIVIKKGRMTAGGFISFRKIDANIISDSAGRHVSSLLSSGYHRTQSEIADRNSLTQFSVGSSIGYKGNGLQMTMNAIYYRLSDPLQKSDEPYDVFAIQGNTWHNASIDYSFTHKNLHFFGEAAIDKRMAIAFINAILLSVDPKVDLAILQRTISSRYQAMYGNAFTENTKPGNERGCYAGISIRPANAWKLDAYADLFSFPWLKYNIDAPGNGIDLLAQASFAPGRHTGISTRLRYQRKPRNAPGNITTTHSLHYSRQQNWRTQVNFRIDQSLSLRSRIELSWYDKKTENQSGGFLACVDVLYKPMLRPWSLVLRCQYVETDDYDSRIYAYENDVLYSYSVPAFSGKGFRYYSVLQYDFSKRISLWFRWAQWLVANGLQVDETGTASKTEVKFQLRYSF